MKCWTYTFYLKIEEKWDIPPFLVDLPFGFLLPGSIYGVGRLEIDGSASQGPPAWLTVP